MEPARLLFRQPAFYAAQAIELDLARTVTAIDRAERRVIDAAGARYRTTRWCSPPARACGHCRCPAPSSTASLYLRTLDHSGELARRARRPGRSW